MTDDPPRNLSDVPDEQLAAFVTSLRSVRDLTITLDQGTLKRLRAYLDRVERSRAGTGYAPGESDEDSLRIGLMALVDHALVEDEKEAGLHYEMLTGHLRHRRSVAFRTRVRQAWKTLRRGW